MFPENRLSTTLQAAAYTYPYTLEPPSKVTAYALGGIGIGDTTQGLSYQLWTAEATPTSVDLYSDTQPRITILDQPNVSELSLAFDQNMNYTLAYTQYGQIKLYWFDTFVGNYVITGMPVGSISPRITLDDRRTTQSGNSDMILGYVRNGNLYFRMQRDRFLNEYLLESNVNGTLVQMGMNVKNRLQFKIKPYRL